MTVHYQDDLDTDELSIEQLMYIALHSDSEAVQKAVKKLEFLIRLSHTEEEINHLSKMLPYYKVRIGVPTDSNTYDYLRFEIQGNNIDVLWDDYNVVGRLQKSKENIFYMGPLK